MDTINFGIYKNNQFKWIARIEILFWRFFIWTIKTMKFSKLIITAGLLVSVTAVLVTFFIISSQNVISSYSHQAPIDLTSGQRNTLLVVVDEKGMPNPKLRSIWLLLELPNKDTLTLIPLYPAAVKNHTVHDQLLENTFAIDKGQSFDESFLTQFSELNIWWDEYILVDDYIMGSLFELSNGSSIAGIPITGSDIRSGHLPEFENKTKQLRFQVGLFQFFCQKISLAPLHPNYQNTIASFSSHTLTSLDNQDIVAMLDHLTHMNHAPNCDFPTLNLTKVTNNLQDSN
jgi:hypothetical protein